eukprot:321808-Prymnesium_polylepis.1
MARAIATAGAELVAAVEQPDFRSQSRPQAREGGNGGSNRAIDRRASNGGVQGVEQGRARTLRRAT